MRELEILGLGAVADEAAGPTPDRPGSGPKHANLHPECLNCGTTLHGRFCSHCGQTDDDHHRSIFHLIWEVVEDFTHLDGRLARTLPPLFIHPGRLARDHFEGRRQRHVPPFRLFLVTLLLFMLSLDLTTGRGEAPTPASAVPPATAPVGGPIQPTPPIPPTPPRSGAPVPAPAPTIVIGPRGAVVDAKDDGGDTTISVGDTHIKVGRQPPKNGLVQLNGDVDKGFDEMAKNKNPMVRWFADHGRRAFAAKDYFRSILFDWAHRLAILLLPIFAGFLTLFYFYKRKYFVYDHLVVAMHFLSFTFLLWGVVYLLPSPVNGFAMAIATIWTPVNLFMTLRGAYGSSIVGAGIKALALWLATLVLFLALLMGVVVVALGSI